MRRWSIQTGCWWPFTPGQRHRLIGIPTRLFLSATRGTALGRNRWWSPGHNESAPANSISSPCRLLWCIKRKRKAKAQYSPHTSPSNWIIDRNGRHFPPKLKLLPRSPITFLLKSWAQICSQNSIPVGQYPPLDAVVVANRVTFICIPYSSLKRRYATITSFFSLRFSSLVSGCYPRASRRNWLAIRTLIGDVKAFWFD